METSTIIIRTHFKLILNCFAGLDFVYLGAQFSWILIDEIISFIQQISLHFADLLPVFSLFT